MLIERLPVSSSGRYGKVRSFALGIQAIEKHCKKAWFFSTIDLVTLDKLGYLPFSPSGGALLLHLLSKLYERSSVIITTNLSFSEWAGVFGNFKMTRRCPMGLPTIATFLENGNDSLRLRATTATGKVGKEKTRDLIEASLKVA